MTRKTIMLLAALLALAVVAAGCGGDDDSAGSATATMSTHGEMAAASRQRLGLERGRRTCA